MAVGGVVSVEVSDGESKLACGFAIGSRLLHRILATDAIAKPQASFNVTPRTTHLSWFALCFILPSTNAERLLQACDLLVHRSRRGGRLLAETRLRLENDDHRPAAGKRLGGQRLPRRQRLGGIDASDAGGTRQAGEIDAVAPG